MQHILAVPSNYSNNFLSPASKFLLPSNFSGELGSKELAKETSFLLILRQVYNEIDASICFPVDMSKLSLLVSNETMTSNFLLAPEDQAINIEL
ncbi:hypothetical protein VNO77_00422 [Canavalia gladiata]|uniref:Uncharacterized protein n=1 Tax=Canavalia gladiata TaxID=3824 RepID=A0AAN9MTY2_CANGL